MKLEFLRPMLWVNDVLATIEYYKNVLGFTDSYYIESYKWGYVVRDGIHIMLATIDRVSKESNPSFTGSLYFTVDHVDDWWNLLKDRAEIFYPIENFAYNMREFAIRDCNGYILQFGTEIDSTQEK